MGSSRQRVLLGLMLASAAARAVTIEQLTGTPAVRGIEISPDGRHLAARVFGGDEHSLVFMDRKTLEPVGGLTLVGRSEVGDFQWVNDERVVGRVFVMPLDDGPPEDYGELFTTDVDGSATEMLFGYRSGERQTGSHIKRKDDDFAWARIIDVLPDDEREILISSTRWSPSRGDVPRVQRLDVYTGLQRQLGVPAKRSDSRFSTDRHGEVRVITSRDEKHRLFVQTLPPGGTWIDVPPSLYGDAFRPLAVTDDGASVYALDNLNGDRIGLYRLSLDGKRFEKIYEHDRVDITDAILSTDQRSVYALRIDDGYPSYLVFSESHEEAQVLKQLLQTFQGMLVSIESRSWDGRFWVVRTASDTDAGAFHLLDREQKSVTRLFSVRPELVPDELAPMRPISFAAPDGRTISGYFTAAVAPADATDRLVAPMVVLVHGGPRLRDFWGYDETVQVLATRGFSVLQVNYRGSAGYGKAFEAASARQWGDAVQKDLIGAARWAIAEKLAQPGRICIMGGGFGAYSAVQSAILAPGLFACVVASAGVYDLELLYRQGDLQTWYAGKALLEEEVGRDQDELRRYSPVHAVEKLSAPVFIAHRRGNEQAPFQHARSLRKALDRHDKPYQWFERRAAHGFYDHARKVEYLNRVIEFLGDHLK